MQIANQLIKLSQPSYYHTALGAAYLGDSLILIKEIPDESIDLICTSPPFALVRKKEYGNKDQNEYIEWFREFAKEFYRVLKPKGSLVIDIGGSWIKGYPVRSLYHFELVIDLCKPQKDGGLGFHLAQELYWYNPAKLPTPAEWVTVRRERVKDAVNTVWWLSKDPHPKSNNKRVLRPYSEAMKNLLKNGYDPKLRPSGHDISDKFGKDRGGAIPPNLINAQVSKEFGEIGTPILGVFDWLILNDLAYPVNVISASNTASNDYYQRMCKKEGIKPHPARFPQALPEFVINLCTEPGDLILDPFAGSNMTGRVAETLQRRWLAFEVDETYLKASQFRFDSEAPFVVMPSPAQTSAKQKVIQIFESISEHENFTQDSLFMKQLTLPFIEENIDIMERTNLKFTYGHQFEPAKFNLTEILQLCLECEPHRRTFEQQIANQYFSGHSKQNMNLEKAAANVAKLAMNTYLSLRAYQLVEKVNDDAWTYKVTALSHEILANRDNLEEVNRIFACHILTNLTGMSLLKAIEAINARGDKPELQIIAYELQEMGYQIDPKAIYISTMRQWLEKAGIFERQYEINWDTVAEFLELDKDYIDELYTLTPEQKYFLLAMIHLDTPQSTPSNKIVDYVTSVYKVRLPEKLLVKQVIEPLRVLGLIEAEKMTGGRGGGRVGTAVKLTKIARNELVSHLLASIAKLTELSQIELNKSFEDVVNDLDSEDKHIKGKALELLAIWMIRLTSLRFTKWRKRDYETGQGEVDVLAASDRFVYHRWQIQCKNTKKVDVNVLAKEVGMTFVTGADVVMIVTTGQFTRDAFQYAYRMMEMSRYYMILLQSEDIEAIKQDRTNIIQILDKKARRVFAKKELGMTDEDISEIDAEEAILSNGYDADMKDV